MPVASSKVTSQGQISIPLEIRKRLGVGPGSVLEWDEEADKIIVRRAGTFTSEDIHHALFHGQTPKPRSLEELKEGLQQHARNRHAGR